MKIAVLVSGGVDSSVALKLLKDERHDVTAFYLKIWLEDETAFLGTCPWEEDLEYVRKVCEQLHVPLKIIPLQKEYHERVVAHTLEEVKAGRTPNPDIMCNSMVKFGAFFDAIDESYEKVATGHYAQVEEMDGVFILKKAPDSTKDQTYFLSRLTQVQLSRALFPIGGYTKQKVRELAEEFDLPNKKRKDSQGLCFLGKIKYDEFVKFHLGQIKGDITEYDTNEVLGRHKGFWFHTIGQRHGLELSGGPWYVVGKDVQKNIVYVAHQMNMDNSQRKKFDVEKVHWILKGGDVDIDKQEVYVKIRHGATQYPCKITSFSKSNFGVELLQNVERGIASGQYAVFYSGEHCLGSGVIV